MPNSTTEPAQDTDADTIAASGAAQMETESWRPQPAADDVPDEVVNLARKGKLPLRIRRGGPGDLHAVIELIDEAKLWLPSKGTNQWSKDWADQKGRKRSDRVQASLEDGTTWVLEGICNDRSYILATVTIELVANTSVWAGASDLENPAVYLSRLVVSREFAGLKLGAAILNWACAYARTIHHADLVRIDVWTRNFALHEYYRKQGFEDAGECPDESYPSRKLFQRSTSKKIRRTPQIQSVVNDWRLATHQSVAKFRTGLAAADSRTRFASAPDRCAVIGRARSRAVN